MLCAVLPRAVVVKPESSVWELGKKKKNWAMLMMRLRAV